MITGQIMHTWSKSWVVEEEVSFNWKMLKILLSNGVQGK